jgi:hypothetical protein
MESASYGSSRSDVAAVSVVRNALLQWVNGCRRFNASWDPINHCHSVVSQNRTLTWIFLLNYKSTFSKCGPGGSVGIATGYGLDGPVIESWWGARFFAHFRTNPGAHPASCTIGTGSFPRVKRRRRGADHPPLLAPRLIISRAIPLFSLWALRGLL